MIKNALAALLCLLLLSACSEQSTITTHYNKAKVQPAPAQFMAGAATVDITPPPGVLPRAGYATWSTTGDGFRTRLYARTYYMRDKDGDSHLIVQTDLAFGSRILQTKLGELLAKHTDIDTSNITITASHTHSGPGQILGSEFYNKHGSHKAGFASQYFDFLIERISSAAMEAYNTQRPSKLATGKIDVWGHTRNRSIQAHVENANVANKSIADNRTFHRINPALYMVRIDSLAADGSYQPLGAFASFSIHGTGLPERESLFNADVWAYIHKDWQWFIEQEYQPSQAVHVSAFEGTHGDIAPANRFGMLGYIEAKRIGQGIAAKTIELYQSLDKQLSDKVNLKSASRYVNLREQNSINGISICQDAAAGMTLAAAPLEHTSPIIGTLPFFKQGSRRSGEEKDNCQGKKQHLGFAFLQPLLEPKDSFPNFVIFQLLQINDMVIAPIPFETTVESGQRFEQAIQEAYADSPEKIKYVMISSLANGYTGYVTTPEEYGRQYYEGGHTIYGKNTQPYIAAHLKQLGQDMLSRTERIIELPEEINYRFVSKQFLPDDMPATGQRKITQVPAFSHASINQESLWRFNWRDINASRIELHKPLVHIETRTQNNNQWGAWLIHKENNIAVNDQGYDVAVRIIASADDKGMSEYSAEWYNPLFDGEQRQFRFVIQPRDGREILYSQGFN